MCLLLIYIKHHTCHEKRLDYECTAKSILLKTPIVSQLDSLIKCMQLNIISSGHCIHLMSTWIYIWIFLRISRSSNGRCTQNRCHHLAFFAVLFHRLLISYMRSSTKENRQTRIVIDDKIILIDCCRYWRIICNASGLEKKKKGGIKIIYSI